MKKHIVLIVFLAVQLVGLACLALWQYVPSSLGMVMWGTALILLTPGNFLGGWLVVTLFWQGHLSLVGIGLLSAVAAVAINGIIWFAVVKVFRLIFGRRSVGRTSGTTAV
jgi:hypothetical protein